MFAALLNRMKKDEKGFTLIELLVVILIIGILAAIALPTFLGQKDKAKDASSKSDARNAVTQVESCLVDDAIANCLSPAGKPASVTVTQVAGTDNYKVDSTSESNNHFFIEKTGAGAYTRTCTTKGSGACPTSGNW